MARRPAHQPLDVYLNGRLVGQFRREATGAVDFKYDQTWLDWDNAIPVSLSLPLREDRFVGDPVFAVFDNLLPDNADIRRRVAEKMGAAGNDAHSHLAAIGRDCVGALQFLPAGQPVLEAAIEGRKVSDAEIAAIIANLARSPLGLGDDEDFRISIAGAQEKTGLLYLKKHWQVPHGTTPTTHILKPQLGVLPNGIDMSRSVENEHFCLSLTNALGMPAAKTAINDFDDQRVLVVERFDRLWTRDKRLLRIPQEDCCQALSVPSSRKYQTDGGPSVADIAELLKGSDQPEADRKMFFKAQVLVWLLAATDGHAKNFSIQLAPGGRFRLAPLYDIMSAQPAHDAQQIRRNRLKLAMSVGENRHYVVDRISPRHFLQDADAAGLPDGSMNGIFEELIDAAPNAIAEARAAMPDDRAADLVDSIVAGFSARLASLKDAANAG
ncbi:MAG: type II toxin-antitoxin system HipA family toxin [Hyphomicrobium sp.]|nr:type II toxin-antitoxin system HipA family toxin [Hyphomicrobium sp.]